MIGPAQQDVVPFSKRDPGRSVGHRGTSESHRLQVLHASMKLPLPPRTAYSRREVNRLPLIAERTGSGEGKPETTTSARRSFMNGSTLIWTVLGGVIGGSVVQWVRIRLDRRVERKRERWKAYRALREFRRRYPSGPPMLELDEMPGVRGSEALPQYVSALSDLVEHVALGWPNDTLAYTMEHLLDALTTLTADRADQKNAIIELYNVCVEHLMVLDLGIAAYRQVGWRALPWVGPPLRLGREWSARRSWAAVASRAPGLPRLMPTAQADEESQPV